MGCLILGLKTWLEKELSPALCFVIWNHNFQLYIYFLLFHCSSAHLSFSFSSQEFPYTILLRLFPDLPPKFFLLSEFNKLSLGSALLGHQRSIWKQKKRLLMPSNNFWAQTLYSDASNAHIRKEILQITVSSLIIVLYFIK